MEAGTCSHFAVFLRLGSGILPVKTVPSWSDLRRCGDIGVVRPVYFGDIARLLITETIIR